MTLQCSLPLTTNALLTLCSLSPGGHDPHRQSCLSCSTLAHTCTGIQQLSLVQMAGSLLFTLLLFPCLIQASSGHAMRRELRRPRPAKPCPLRAARLAVPADVWCVHSPLLSTQSPQLIVCYALQHLTQLLLISTHPWSFLGHALFSSIYQPAPTAELHCTNVHMQPWYRIRTMPSSPAFLSSIWITRYPCTLYLCISASPTWTPDRPSLESLTQLPANTIANTNSRRPTLPRQ